MQHEIGDAAGLIWRALDEAGDATTLPRLKQGTNLADQMLLLGLGWLAREGKVDLLRDRRTLKVQLRREDA